VDHRRLELETAGCVDVVLIDLDVHLAHRAGGDDHVGPAVVGRLDDALDHLLGFSDAGVADGGGTADGLAESYFSMRGSRRVIRQ